MWNTPFTHGHLPRKARPAIMGDAYTLLEKEATMPSAKDYTGKRFRMITLTRYSQPGPKGRGAMWWGICDCGNRREFVVKDVVHGKLVSCGKCAEFKALHISQASERLLLRQKMAKELKRAEWEGGDWNLTPGQLQRTLKAECFFCGETSFGVAKMRSEPGYTMGNVVPECRDCRARRMKLTAEEFINYLWRVIHYQVKHEKPLDIEL